MAGATTIIAVDLDPKKLEWAKAFGATHTVNPNDGDAVAAIKEITGGYGVNVSFEAVGSAPYVYDMRGKPLPLSYWSLPDEAMDSPQAMQPWARLAIEAAQRKPPPKPRRKRSR